jgi:hypothetical protein
MNANHPTPVSFAWCKAAPLKRALSLSFGEGSAFLLAACFFLLTAEAPAQPAGSGVVTGQVSNAATKSYLEGAVVELVGTNQITTTDREGRYQFAGVDGETVTLAVSFTGLDSQRIPVSVGPGRRVVRDIALTSEIYKLDKFTVAGER